MGARRKNTPGYKAEPTAPQTEEIIANLLLPVCALQIIA